MGASVGPGGALTSAADRPRSRKESPGSSLPTRVAQNLILRYLDRNRELLTEEFLEAAHSVPTGSQG